MVLLLTPTSSLVDIYYHSDPAYRDAYKEYLAHPDDAAAQERFEKLREERMVIPPRGN